MPSKHWWALRRQFEKSIPKAVTAGYLSNLLDMTEQSASANILPCLRATELIDEDNIPTELATDWRDDESYPQVCRQIREKLYPHDLLDPFPGPDVDRERVERWFKNQTGFGVGAAKNMARFFELLVEADPSKESRTPARASSSTRITSQRPQNKPDSTVSSETEPSQGVAQLPKVAISNRPTLHIDIQIHIDPSSSASQIDQIFKSMARHLNLVDSDHDE